MPLHLFALLTAPITANFQSWDRAAAQSASGIEAKPGAWVLKGTAEMHGVTQPFEIDFDSKYRFRINVTGKLPDSNGFDGANYWTNGFSLVPHDTILEERDFTRLATYVLSGLWTLPDAPITATPAAAEIKVQCKDAVMGATLTLDPASKLPSKLTHWGTEGEDTWSFEGYKKLAGINLPTHILRKGGDTNIAFNITSAEYAKTPPSFAKPKPDDSGVVFDKNASPEFEVKRLGVYLMVRPKLEGKDEGWFFFDTGADVMVIDPKVARDHGYEVVGHDPTAGVVGTIDLKISRGKDFKLGPITLKNPTYAELDLSQISAAVHLPVAGICGYDVISRAVFDIDPTKTVIRALPAGTAAPAGSSWTPFQFNSNVPCVKCKYEGGHEGYFNLDTGSGSTVDFCSPVVERFKLLDNRAAKTTMTGGAGGVAESKTATLDWFELAGRRFEKPTVGLQITKKGVLASPFFDGNIGMGFMSQLHLVLDYANSRVSLSKP